MQGVYKIENIVNHKIYVGSSVDINKRFDSHIKSLRKGKHNNKYLQRAWDKYGECNFDFAIIELVDDKDKIRDREQYYIELYDSSNHSCGYNILPNTNIGLGVSVSEEVRVKISEQCKGSKNGHYGKTHTEETKERIRLIKLEQGKIKRELRQQKWREEKHRCEVCGNVMVTKYASGRFCSKECVVANISMKNKQVVHTKEWNEKMRKSLTGKKFTEEHREKLSKSAKERMKNPKNNPMYGKRHTEESKKKISESLKRRRENDKQ